MCFTIVSQQPLRKLIASAGAVKNLLDDGTMANAFLKGDGHAAQQTATAIQILNENAYGILADQKEVSPFLRYRREILAHYDTAAHLRALVLNLWGGRPANLSLLFMGADDYHTRIALELIAGYTRLGENDSQFMSLASEIRDLYLEEESHA